MANRKGVFIGAYVPNELKESLRRRAALEHRTLSQEITRILVEAVHGKGLPAGSVDRRGTAAIPRRRASDPATRRRAEDLPYIAPEGKKK
jgi:plasmid stability protein